MRPRNIWILVSPSKSSFYYRTLVNLSDALNEIGEQSVVAGKNVKLPLGNNIILFSINLQNSLRIDNFKHHFSWIQDPAPWLSTTMLRKSECLTPLFLGEAIAREAGFSKENVFLPGEDFSKMQLNRDSNLSKSENALHNYSISQHYYGHLVMLKNYISLKTALGIELPNLTALAGEFYKPCSGALDTRHLINFLHENISNSSSLKWEISNICSKKINMHLFQSQKLISRNISIGSKSCSSRSYKSKLLWLSIHLPRILDQERVVDIINESDVPAVCFGRDWNLSRIRRDAIFGPVEPEDIMKALKSENAVGLHINAHGLVAHPTPIIFAKYQIPILTHTSPHSNLEGGVNNFSLPELKVIHLDNLKFELEQTQWLERPKFSSQFRDQNSWLSRAIQLANLMN